MTGHTPPKPGEERGNNALPPSEPAPFTAPSAPESPGNMAPNPWSAQYPQQQPSGPQRNNQPDQSTQGPQAGQVPPAGPGNAWQPPTPPNYGYGPAGPQQPQHGHPPAHNQEQASPGGHQFGRPGAGPSSQADPGQAGPWNQPHPGHQQQPGSHAHPGHQFPGHTPGPQEQQAPWAESYPSAPSAPSGPIDLNRSAPLGPVPSAPSGPAPSAPSGPAGGFPPAQSAPPMGVGYKPQIDQLPVMGPGAPSYQQQTQGFDSAPSSTDTGGQFQPGQYQQAGQYGQNPAQDDHQPVQYAPQGNYSGPSPYQFNSGGYGAPPKKNTKLWVILGSLLAVVIVVGVILFFVFTGEDKYREGMEVMFEESDLTAISAQDAGVMTKEQYDAWFNCVVEEGRDSYPDSLIEKIEEQDFDMTPSEQGEMTTVFTRCLEEHVG